MKTRLNTLLGKYSSPLPDRGSGHGVVQLRHDPGVNVSDVCGSSWWGIIHGVAQSIHDYGCQSCGVHAISLMKYAHDLTNVSLGKPVHEPEAVKEWTPFAQQLATGAVVHQAQRRPPKCRFDAATFDTNPGAVSKFMGELEKAQKAGDADVFVRELNGLCSTTQPRLPGIGRPTAKRTKPPQIATITDRKPELVDRRQIGLLQEDDPVKIAGKCSGTECSLTATAGGKTLIKQPKIKVPVTAVTHEGVRRAVKDARAQLKEAMGEGPAAEVVPEVVKKPKAKRPAPAPPLQGFDTFAQLNGDRIELQTMVLPASTVVTSNDPLTFEINPEYPGWLQPRDRSRAANVVQVRTMAGALDPDRLLDDFHTLEGGPPVVWASYPVGKASGPRWSVAPGLTFNVVSGNGRAMAIKLAIEEHPDVYSKYRTALQGRWPKALPASTTPTMMVRVLNPPGEPAISQARVKEIAELGNVAKAIATSSVEQAAIDSGKMTSEFVGRLQPMEDQNASLEQTIRASKNRQWVIQFMKNVPATEAAAMADDKGRVSESGVKRIVMALAMWTFGVENGNKIAELAFESIDQEARAIVQGTMKAVPLFATMIARLQGFVDNAPEETRVAAITTRDELNILPAVASSLLAYVEIKRSGVTVQDRLKQKGFVDFDIDYTTMELLLINMYDSRKRSARAITEFFASYVERANEVPDPNQTSMFGVDHGDAIEPGDAAKAVGELVTEPRTPAGQGQMMELSAAPCSASETYQIASCSRAANRRTRGKR